MKKSTIIVAILILALTGCGKDNSNTAEKQKEIVEVSNSEKIEKELEMPEETVLGVAKCNTIKVQVLKNETNTVLEENGLVEKNIDGSVVASVAVPISENNNSNTTSGNRNGNTSSSSGSNTNNGSSNSNSNSNSNTSTSVHTHSWVHVDATGHYETVTIQEAYDEQVPIYEEKARSVCNQCGMDITECCDEHMKTGMLTGTCWAWHIEYIQIQTGTQTIHHEAVTEQRWVEDTPAHEVCSGCGTTR